MIALNELQRHVDRASNTIKAEAALIDRSIPMRRAATFAQISIDYLAKLVPMIRDQARSMDSLPALSRQVMFNTLLSMCVANYAQATDTMLSFSDTTQTNGSSAAFLEGRSQHRPARPASRTGGRVERGRSDGRCTDSDRRFLNRRRRHFFGTRKRHVKTITIDVRVRQQQRLPQYAKTRAGAGCGVIFLACVGRRKPTATQCRAAAFRSVRAQAHHQR
jgi:hypothetical protein